ncbi:MAG TPA: hypothetical protein VGZ33_01265 [Acidimicrobiales bacterium]|jgi:hypothetical protein|nr:hypothetical protein [Acidimicrobiales bacterium]
MTSRSRRALVALYPARWRERYGEEVLGFLDDDFAEDRLPLGVVADLTTSAVVERSRRVFDVPASLHDADRTRGLRLLIWGWCCCVIGGIGFAKMTEHFATARYLPRGIPDGALVASRSFNVVQVLAAIAALLIALVAAPAILVTATRGGAEARRRLVVAASLAIAASAVTAAWLAVLVAWAHGLSASQRNGGDTRYGLAVVGLAAAVTLSLAAWTVVANSALREVRPTSGGVPIRWVARGAAACTVLVAVGAGLWWVAVGVDAPGFFGSVRPNSAAVTTEWPLVLLALCLLVAGAALAVAGAWVSSPADHGGGEASPLVETTS